MIFGSLVGSMLFALIYSVLGFASPVFFWTLVLLNTLGFGLCGYWQRKSFTSMTNFLAATGGMLFVRGLSLLIGGWPVDAVVTGLAANDLPLEIQPTIWAYFFASITCSWVFLCWLSLYSMQYCDRKVVNYYEKAELENDSDFKAVRS
mmetsp:Transcript_40012/g.52386  ORF Transcript_40012/g.52386 Transcript_40012/m.52386 type:complete len:148 (+) Transcript_40012:839-1282(+)